MLDTNVLISAVLSPRKACYELIEQLISLHKKLYVSKELLEELETVLKRPKIRRRLSVSAEEFIHMYLQQTTLVDVETSELHVRDPDDIAHLALAVQTGATLITGDSDLLDLVDTDTIMSVADALQEITAMKSSKKKK